MNVPKRCLSWEILPRGWSIFLGLILSVLGTSRNMKKKSTAKASVFLSKKKGDWCLLNFNVKWTKPRISEFEILYVMPYSFLFLTGFPYDQCINLHDVSLWQRSYITVTFIVTLIYFMAFKSFVSETLVILNKLRMKDIPWSTVLILLQGQNTLKAGMIK